MGSSGWSIALKPAAGKGAATLARVRDAVLDRLYHTFRDWLPGRYSSVAWRWMSLGEDSLLTIGERDMDRTVPGQITFWFYESVSWPEGLAEHWLRLALALDRRNMEVALGRLKHAIDDADGAYPTVRSSFSLDGERDRRLFFEHAGKIGVASRDDIEWVVSEVGDDHDIPSTPFAELDEDARARVLEVLDRGVCACPFCKRIAERIGLAGAEGAPGWKVTPVQAWSVWSIMHFESFEDDSSIVATTGFRRAAWALRAAKRGAPFLTVEALSHDKRKLYFLARSGGALVAWVAAENPRPGQPPLRVSSDLGATWATEEPQGIPLNTPGRFHVDRQRPGTVYATPNRKRTLYRSDDGGRSWIVITNELACGAEPVDLCFDLASARDDASRLFAVFQHKKAVKHPGFSSQRRDVIARSDDGGASFRALVGPKSFSPRQVLIGGGGVVAAFGPSGRGAMMARSTDAGETWGDLKEIEGRGHAHAVGAGAGRWFWSVEGASPGLFTSSNNGVTWDPCARLTAGRIFLDPAAPDAVMAATRMALVRIEPAVTAA